MNWQEVEKETIENPKNLSDFAEHLGVKNEYAQKIITIPVAIGVSLFSGTEKQIKKWKARNA